MLDPDGIKATDGINMVSWNTPCVGTGNGISVIAWTEDMVKGKGGTSPFKSQRPKGKTTRVSKIQQRIIRGSTNLKMKDKSLRITRSNNGNKN